MGAILFESELELPLPLFSAPVSLPSLKLLGIFRLSMHWFVMYWMISSTLGLAYIMYSVVMPKMSESFTFLSLAASLEI